MTPSEIAALRALCDAATPGPWAAYGRGVDSEAAETYGQTVIGQETRGRSYMTYEELVVSDPDQAFIIAARTALPQALSALEEARKCDSPTPVLGCDCTRCIQHFHRAAVLARNAAEFRADALQAEVERLRRDLSNAQIVIAGEAKAKVEARAALERATNSRSGWREGCIRWEAEAKSAKSRADAAWRAALEAAAAHIRAWALRAYSNPDPRLAEEILALPPPSATPNEEK